MSSCRSPSPPPLPAGSVIPGGAGWIWTRSRRKIFLPSVHSPGGRKKNQRIDFSSFSLREAAFGLVRPRRSISFLPTQWLSGYVAHWIEFVPHRFGLVRDGACDC